jgi:hypothetical protein
LHGVFALSYVKSRYSQHEFCSAGLQTPDAIALRKSGYGTETPHDGFTSNNKKRFLVCIDERRPALL